MKVKEILPSLLAQWKIKVSEIPTDSKGNDIQIPIIVSLTSIPNRLDKLDIVIKSILLQTQLPKKIILWLNYDLKNKLPKKLLDLTNVKIRNKQIFEIHYSNLTCSHRKLIHSLDLYPNDTIVTCDDDSIYPNNWLELLYTDQTNNPNTIIANRTCFITYDKNNKTIPYSKWDKNVPTATHSLSILPIGCDGILYPPGSFHKDITNSDLFLKLTPKADDLWFKAMSFLNQTQCMQASIPCKKPITLIGSQKFSLSKKNVRLDQNKDQWNALREHYNFKTPNQIKT
ncbi:MAG: glycosyltransferase family 2 protein [Saccharospirillaceae bacterium]|nr:hypothetical protein [Pseudomonadales bacterium]NRB80653.1 glycosyltransferase family 2 protein [Saccharospirillaceae bacterium]